MLQATCYITSPLLLLLLLLASLALLLTTLLVLERLALFFYFLYLTFKDPLLLINQTENQPLNLAS